MYRSYFQKDGKTYALDKTGKFKEIETTNNVENILVAKNNIEEIENLLNDLKEKQISSKDSFNTTKIITFIIDIIGIVIAVLPIGIPLKILGLLMFIFSNAGFIKDCNNYTKKKNEYDNKLEILEKMFTIEKEKIKALEKNAKIIQKPINTKEKNIDRSKKIKELYRKLELISYYYQNSLKINYDLKNHGKKYLKNKLSSQFSNEEINFIIKLIEISNNNNIENNKIKYLK